MFVRNVTPPRNLSYSPHTPKTQSALRGESDMLEAIPQCLSSLFHVPSMSKRGSFNLHERAYMYKTGKKYEIADVSKRTPYLDSIQLNFAIHSGTYSSCHPPSPHSACTQKVNQEPTSSLISSLVKTFRQNTPFKGKSRHQNNTPTQLPHKLTTFYTFQPL